MLFLLQGNRVGQTTTNPTFLFLVLRQKNEGCYTPPGKANPYMKRDHFGGYLDLVEVMPIGEIISSIGLIAVDGG